MCYLCLSPLHVIQQSVMFIYHGVLNLMFECLLNRLLCFWRLAVLSPQLSICSMMSENKDAAFVDAKNICTHQYQCPNPLCQRVFASQRGLSMHFYHQNNVCCNPPKRLRTHAEVVFPSHLPEQLPPLSIHSL